MRSAVAENFDLATVFDGTRSASALGSGSSPRCGRLAARWTQRPSARKSRIRNATYRASGVIGLTVVSSVYLCLNLAYLMVLPADVIAPRVDERGLETGDGGFSSREPWRAATPVWR
jgi:hypothetical protein